MNLTGNIPRTRKSRHDKGLIPEGANKIIEAENRISRLIRNGVDPTVAQAELIRTALELKREQLPHLYERKWYKWAYDFFTTREKIALLTAANQVSKALEYGTEIPTPEGFKSIEDLRVGDTVYSQSGAPTRVTAIPFDGTDECFRITFDDDSSVVASGEHLWVCKDNKRRFRKSYTSHGRTWDNDLYGKWGVLSTKAIIASGDYSPEAKNNGRRVTIPVCEAVHRDHDDSLFDPYLIGLLIGDGSMLRGVILSNPEPEIQDYVKSRYGAVQSGKPIDYRLTGLQPVLRELGLFGKRSWEKSIPQRYLSASIEQRMQLLHGLMDTDGSAGKNGSAIYTTTSRRLADDFTDLVTSLGGTCQLSVRPTTYRYLGVMKKGRDAYCIAVFSLFNPFSLPRKADRWFLKSRCNFERVIWKIEPVGVRRCRCITVEDASGTFLATRNHVVTHNSSTLIRLFIEWAGNPKLWPELWPADPNPRIFWYFYPSMPVATVEFEKKWIPEFLPRGDGKAHVTYGWHANYGKDGYIESLYFNSGVTIYFHSYTKQMVNLQTATVHLIGMDEECGDEKLVNELMSRRRGTDGYFKKVFTATEGSELWYRAMERIGEDNEAFRGAWKRSVSLYDSMEYMDGTPSKWTLERIKAEEASCTSEAERLKRVMGRFVRDEGVQYPTYSPDVHIVQPFKIPTEWSRYAAVDLGGNQSETRSKAAVLFVAVNPEMTEAYVYKMWRGDNEKTTAGDVLDKYHEMRGDEYITAKAYDYASSDFLEMATRRGDAFQPAIKERTAGVRMLNELFHTRALKIFATGDYTKLSGELLNVSPGSKKNKQVDDLSDALRYCIRLIPFNWEKIAGSTHGEKWRAAVEAKKAVPIDERREAYQIMKQGYNPSYQAELESELEAWNEAYGN